MECPNHPRMGHFLLFYATESQPIIFTRKSLFLSSREKKHTEGKPQALYHEYHETNIQNVKTYCYKIHRTLFLQGIIMLNLNMQG